MTPHYLGYIRRFSGLPIAAFARALGYSGKHANARKQVIDMEAGRRPIREEKRAAVYEIEALTIAIFEESWKGRAADFGSSGVSTGCKGAARRLLATGHLSGSIRSASITPAGRERIGG